MKSMTAMNATRKQAGFTIIELVVVILLLGILTATALPRFMDVTDEAHAAVVDGIEGGLTTGNALFRAQWVAEGQPLTTAVIEFDLFANAVTGGTGQTMGYPKGANLTLDANSCLEVYQGVLQPGGRPNAVQLALSETPTTGASETELEGVAATAVIAAATLEGATGITDAEVCHYYYLGQYRNGTAANPVDVPYLIYNFTTGVVGRGSVTLNN